MATNVGQIYYDVSLDTRQMIIGQRDVDKAVNKTGGSLDQLGGKLNMVTAAIKVLAVAMAVIKSVNLADELNMLRTRVDIAAGSIDSGAAAMAGLRDISMRTQTALADNVQVFTRLNASLLQMGGTQHDTLRLTELLGMALRVSGGTAQEASSAMLQFGQALGSGKLAGDEFRSLMENAPYLMKQLAESLGVPIGALKQMAADGKLTADVVTKAMLGASETIRKDFAQIPAALGPAWTVAVDAAIAANEKFDQLSGTSVILTGVTKGFGEGLKALADQLGAANKEAGTLGRNNAIKEWADKAKIAFSYVIDAVDVTWQALSVFGRNVAYVFKGVGNEIGGIAAQAKAVATGDFRGAWEIGKAMREEAAKNRAKLDEEDKKTLSRTKTMGEEMREAWNRGAGAGRGFINPPLVGDKGSKLKSTATEEPKKKTGKPFDQAAYLSSLRVAQASEIETINATEVEKMRIAKKNLDEKKISEGAYMEAISLIYQKAEEERQTLAFKTQEQINKDRLQSEQEAARDRANIADQRAQATEAIAANDPVAAVRLEEEQRVAVLEEYRQMDLANSQLYEDAKLAVHTAAAERIKKIDEDMAQAKVQANQMALMSTSNAFGAMAGVLKDSGAEQSAAFKVMFAAQKAFSIASSLVAIQNGIAQAAAQPWPLNLAAMASTIAATASIISTISGTSYGGGRQYGGPVSGGSMYRVNETGQPEMFTAANGNQYMMPNKSGSVTPANQLGGGMPNITVIFQSSGGQMQETSRSWDDQSKTVTIAVAEVAQQISSNSGQVWAALRGSTNIAPRMS